MKLILMAVAGLIPGVFFSTVAAPAWVNALAAGQWYQIPNTAMSTCAPNPVPAGNSGPSAKVTAWTSFAADTRTSKVYSVANGGHGDYAGNEVDALSLDTETPGWAEILKSSTSFQYDVDYYSDGRPTSRHSYMGVTFNEMGDRIMLFGGCPWGAGTFRKAISSYNIGSNTYSPASAHEILTGNNATYFGGMEGSWVEDPATGDAYVLGQFRLGRWSRSANSFAQLSPTGGGLGGIMGAEAMGAFDSNRGRFFWLGSWSSGSAAHNTYTIATNTTQAVTLSGANAADACCFAKGAMTFAAGVDLFLIRKREAGGTVYQVNPVTWAVTIFPTTGGASIPASNSGPFKKFLYLPKLGGAVYVQSYTGNAWFLKLHAPSTAMLPHAEATELNMTVYPNPFKSSVTLSLGKRGILQRPMTLKIYDLRGRELADLSGMSGRSDVVRWNAVNATPGVYIARVSYIGVTLERKLYLIK